MLSARQRAACLPNRPSALVLTPPGSSPQIRREIRRFAASICQPRATRGYPPDLGDTGRAVVGRAGSINSGKNSTNSRLLDFYLFLITVWMAEWRHPDMVRRTTTARSGLPTVTADLTRAAPGCEVGVRRRTSTDRARDHTASAFSSSPLMDSSITRRLADESALKHTWQLAAIAARA